jgi:hypothetical protein
VRQAGGVPQAGPHLVQVLSGYLLQDEYAAADQLLDDGASATIPAFPIMPTTRISRTFARDCGQALSRVHLVADMRWTFEAIDI